MGSAEWAFVAVYGILTMIAGVMLAKALGFERPNSPAAGSPMIVIAGMYSIRPRPDMLRNNTFWIKRSLVYLCTNVGVILLMVWAYQMAGDVGTMFFPSLGISAVLWALAIMIPKQFTERIPDTPRWHVADMLIALIFSTVFHLTDLLFRSIGLTA